LTKGERALKPQLILAKRSLTKQNNNKKNVTETATTKINAAGFIVIHLMFLCAFCLGISKYNSNVQK
jgi:hypothetical protein